ncbi:MAG: hypothetical protein HZB13_08115, partial [Acidobacteria bacterium]|nr:hypothetical protein [Acidobacteriota bacterium]
MQPGSIPQESPPSFSGGTPETGAPAVTLRADFAALVLEGIAGTPALETHAADGRWAGVKGDSLFALPGQRSPVPGGVGDIQVDTERSESTAESNVADSREDPAIEQATTLAVVVAPAADVVFALAFPQWRPTDDGAREPDKSVRANDGAEEAEPSTAARVVLKAAADEPARSGFEPVPLQA